MQITMVGTGNAFAKKYDNNNALIEHDGYRLLLDCGITLPRALHEMGLSFAQLDAVLISHIHGDHVGGLEEMGFQMMFKFQRKPLLYISEQLIEPLWEHTLRGGMTQDPLDRLTDFFEVKPLATGKEYTLAPGISVELLQTKHIEGKASFSFIFNRTFFYSADMRFDPELLETLATRGVERFYHDCQLESPGVVHAALDELLTLPEELQQRIWLMHYGDAINDFREKTGAMRIVEQRETYEV